MKVQECVVAGHTFFTAYRENGMMAHGGSREEAELKLHTLGWGPEYTWSYDSLTFRVRKDGVFGHGASPSEAVSDLERKLKTTWYRARVMKLFKNMRRCARICADNTGAGIEEAKHHMSEVESFIADYYAKENL